jgi:hypothetical protein
MNETGRSGERRASDRILVRDPTSPRELLAVIEGKSSFAYFLPRACFLPGSG